MSRANEPGWSAFGFSAKVCIVALLPIAAKLHPIN
jgi:hypothetical protein